MRQSEGRHGYGMRSCAELGGLSSICQQDVIFFQGSSLTLGVNDVLDTNDKAMQ